MYYLSLCLAEALEIILSTLLNHTHYINCTSTPGKHRVINQLNEHCANSAHKVYHKIFEYAFSFHVK